MLICRLCECEIRSFKAFECISIFGYRVLMSEFECEKVHCLKL